MRAKYPFIFDPGLGDDAYARPQSKFVDQATWILSTTRARFARNARPVDRELSDRVEDSSEQGGMARLFTRAAAVSNSRGACTAVLDPTGCVYAYRAGSCTG